jgi:hypothetical protein
MRRNGIRFGVALLMGPVAAAPAWALSDHVLTVATLAFTMPKTLSDACRARIPAAASEAEAAATLDACRIPFVRTSSSRLRSQTPPEEWAATLAAAPIGKPALRQEGDRATFTIVQSDRIIGLASVADSFAIRRIIYQGMLDADMQRELGPIHEMDGVIRVLTAHHVRFVEDGGTLLARSLPADVVKSLTDKPDEPVVIQHRDQGEIYTRRMGP